MHVQVRIVRSAYSTVEATAGPRSPRRLKRGGGRGRASLVPSELLEEFLLGSLPAVAHLGVEVAVEGRRRVAPALVHGRDDGLLMLNAEVAL